jgi:DNA replication factor Dna2
LFRVLLTGKWAKQLWVQNNDTVRVIGTFAKDNLFTLSIDDDQPKDAEEMVEFKKKKASMIIVEPYILIPTTQIVKAFPCVRKAFLSN